jgi:hypothetical protein
MSLQDEQEPDPADDTRRQSRWKFIREVGSVVLGVLIALALGEVAEAVRWQVRTAKSNAAIDLELSRTSGVLDERVLVQPCLDQRLALLDRIIRAARATGSLPAIGEIGRPPSRPVQSAA